ncbi:MAG: hypothetical protein ABIH67_05305 [Candidatus Uhrbacteria bacterium]
MSEITERRRQYTHGQARKLIKEYGHRRVRLRIREAMTVTPGPEVQEKLQPLRQRLALLEAVDSSERQAMFESDLNKVLALERQTPFIQLFKLRRQRGLWDMMRLCRMRFHGGCDRHRSLRKVLESHDILWLQSRLRSWEFVADAILSTEVQSKAA